MVAYHPFWSLAIHFSPVACAVLLCIPVKADRSLIKDVLTCHPLVESIYKSRHPDDTDDAKAVGLSSEDEAEDMGEVLGVSRWLPKPAPPSSSPRQHEPESHEASPDPVPEGNIIKVPKKDLKRAQNIIKDMLAGKKVRWGTAASKEDIPFSVPDVQAGRPLASCATGPFLARDRCDTTCRPTLGTPDSPAVGVARFWLPGSHGTCTWRVAEGRRTTSVWNVTGATSANKH